MLLLLLPLLVLSQDSLDPSLSPSDQPKEIVVRAIGEPTEQDGKFSVYIGTIDGVRRMVFQEVDGGQDRVPADTGVNPADPFGAYDDNHIINAEHERTIFVPRPYRPGQKKEEEEEHTTTTTTTTTTQRPTTSFRPTQPFITRRPEPLPISRPSLPSPPRVNLPQRAPLTRPPVTLPPPPRTTTPFQGDPTGLRSGTCQNSIFYISTPINGPTRLTFTHFAIAVTVDQCARTCHEFNCAIAHYNPINGHCEFNPSTAFAIRNGQCPAWPSLHYRNNVVASEPVRIFCVACQKPRRRINRGSKRSTNSQVFPGLSETRLSGLSHRFESQLTDEFADEE
ncbi:hypothetical protein PENTCL1PPCAC_6593 [Pristionchus entomophagus]|uniref:Apple domain-containing protein n=1 Tax=Pristionchus entomophagus TaxID=358040 RepID=A0AAV5SUW6_9BILA|nr:hypothetical protein PENTCL1PPCAC_6593 [Pristionchus entomophagus]